jgi:hypothetical protein
MRLKVNHVSNGPGPGEVIVEITTANGQTEEVIVDTRSLDAHDIEVGQPIAQRNGHTLVELPRETMSGRWRIWVDNSQVAAR